MDVIQTEVRQSKEGSPWGAKLPTGGVIYGCDENISESQPTCSAVISARRLQSLSFSPLDSPSSSSSFSCFPDPSAEISNESLDKKLDLLLEVEFPESRHDDTRGFSVNDKKVLQH